MPVIPCTGVLIGALAAHHTVLTAAVGAAGVFIIAVVVMVSRLGATVTLIWSYFFLSITDPSKSPAFLAEPWFQEIPIIGWFLPGILGLVGVLMVVGIVRVLTTFYREPQLTMITGTWILLLLSLMFYGLAIAMLHGRSSMLVLSNTIYILGYFLFFPFAAAIRDWSSWRFLSNGFMAAIAALCIEIAGLYILLFAGSEALPRIFLRGSVFFQVGAIVSLSVLSAKGEGLTPRRQLFFIILGISSFVGLVLSNTRGYYLGFYTSLLVLIFLMKIRERMRFLRIALIILIGIVIFLIPMNVSITRNIVGEWSTEAFYTSLDIRSQQLPLLLGRFQQAPISGLGLGASAEEAEEDEFSTQNGGEGSAEGLSAVLGDIIRSVRRPYLYELDHIALLMKFGIVGTLGWMWLWGLIIIQGISVSRRMSLGYHRALLIGYVAGFVGCLVSGATNPVMSSMLTTSFVAFVLALINAAHVFIAKAHDTSEAG